MIKRIVCFFIILSLVPQLTCSSLLEEAIIVKESSSIRPRNVSGFSPKRTVLFTKERLEEEERATRNSKKKKKKRLEKSRREKVDPLQRYLALTPKGLYDLENDAQFISWCQSLKGKLPKKYFSILSSSGFFEHLSIEKQFYLSVLHKYLKGKNKKRTKHFFQSTLKNEDTSLTSCLLKARIYQENEGFGHPVAYLRAGMCAVKNRKKGKSSYQKHYLPFIGEGVNSQTKREQLLEFTHFFATALQQQTAPSEEDIEDVIHFSLFLIMDPHLSHDERMNALKTLQAAQSLQEGEKRDKFIRSSNDEKNEARAATYAPQVLDFIFFSQDLAFLTTVDPFLFLERNLEKYKAAKEYFRSQKESYVNLSVKLKELRDTSPGLSGLLQDMRDVIFSIPLSILRLKHQQKNNPQKQFSQREQEARAKAEERYDTLSAASKGFFIPSELLLAFCLEMSVTEISPPALEVPKRTRGRFYFKERHPPLIPLNTHISRFKEAEKILEDVFENPHASREQRKQAEKSLDRVRGKIEKEDPPSSLTHIKRRHEYAPVRWEGLN